MTFQGSKIAPPISDPLSISSFNHDGEFPPSLIYGKRLVASSLLGKFLSGNPLPIP
jgi:hypothetical protein